MQSVSNAHEVLASVDRALCVQCAMFTVPQDEGFRISGGATEFGTGRKKTAHDSDREYHLLGSTIRACWGFTCEGRRRRGFNSDRVTPLWRLTRISVIRTRDGAFARHHRTEERQGLVGK